MTIQYQSQQYNEYSLQAGVYIHYTLRINAQCKNAFLGAQGNLMI